MYLDTRNGLNIVIANLPQTFTFSASSGLGVEDGSTTGDFPDVDPKFHTAEGFLPFTQTKPSYDSSTQTSEMQPIIIADDRKSASQTWIIRNKTSEELAADVAAKWSDIRAQRDSLLQQTDWTQLADSKCSTTWTAYRQELRDIPQTYQTPADVIWPSKPGV